ncbi:MAG: HlyD family type I secretion periplasmic adaptor subunit [Xanthobacteraceae bacterium]
MPAPSPAPKVPDDPTREIRAGIAVIVLFFGVLGTWAALAPVAGAAVAAGVTKVQGNRQTVQHREGGIVERLDVRDGDKVEKGQVLIRLDRTAAQAKADTLAAQRDSLKALEARLIAERDGREQPSFDALASRHHEPRVAEAMANQSVIFRSRSRKYQTEIAVHRQKIARLGEQIAGAQTQAESAERQIALIGEELEGVRYLYERGLSPKTRVLALERAQAGLSGERGAKRAEIAKAHESIAETELTIERAEHARMSEVTGELRDTQTQLAQLEPQLQAAREALTRTDLVAPVAGEVVGLAVFTEGGVIAPGARLLDIVPSAGLLVVDARIRPQDIDDVSPGQSADVRFTGVALRHRPPLTGTVETISADRLEDSRTGEPYYSSQIRIDASSLAREGVSLQAGMPADVLIVTKSRSVLDYLIAPLRDEMARGFREH